MQANEFTEISLTSPDRHNLLRLKAISKSFDDLTSETLYSRWKRKRQNNKERPRSASRLPSSTHLSLPELKEQDENANDICDPPDEGITAGNAQRHTVRARGWTIQCPGEFAIRSETPQTDGADSVISDSYSSSEITETESLSMESDSGVEEWKTRSSSSPVPSLDFSEISEDDAVFAASPSTPPVVRYYPRWFPPGGSASDVSDMFTHDGTCDQGKASVKENPGKENIFVTEITTNAFGKFSKKVRSFSEGDQLKKEQPIKARLIRGRNSQEFRKQSLSAREPRELQFLRTAEMARQYLQNSVANLDDVWLKRDTASTAKLDSRRKRPSGVDAKHKGLVNNIHGPTLGQIPDRSHHCTFGTTYTVVSQPIDSSIHRDSNQSQQPDRKISAPAATTYKLEAEDLLEELELRDQLPSEVSRRGLSLNRRTYGSQVARSQSFAGESSHRAATMPRLSRRATSVLSNRKASEQRSRQVAKELLDKITKAGEKSEKERLDVVERAFEWIRKELADLRTQDKDIMRMFTKIQAGIRHMKFDQSALLEGAEDDFHSTPDLSQSFSYSMTPKEETQLPRRASLL